MKQKLAIVVAVLAGIAYAALIAYVVPRHPTNQPADCPVQSSSIGAFKLFGC